MTLRLYIHQPDTVFAARVNQSTFSYPLDEVTFDTVTTGAYTDIEEGFTVFFGSTAGDWDYGIQRVRKAATSDTLYIGRSSEGARWGEVDPVNDAYITIVEDARVWAKIPHIELDTSTNPPTSTTYMDSDIAVGTYTTNKPPIAQGSWAAAQTIDPNTSAITVDFSAADSVATTVGATITGYEWDVRDGTITSGTSTSRDITATFPAGKRLVKLTVTDSNGQTHFTRIPVLARDPAADTSIDSFRIVTRVLRRDGQEFEVQITESIPVGTYPPGTLAMVWDGEPSTAADKTNVIITGWLADERENLRAQRTGNLKDCTIAIKDVAGRLKQIPGFSISVTNADSPAKWTEMSALTSNLMLHYLLQWFSTALEVTSTDWFDATYLEHYRFNVDGATIWEMVDGLARKLKPDNYFTCDTHGELKLLPDPLLQATADRTVTVQQALTESDITAISSMRRPEPQVHWWRAGAHLADYNSENTVFCIAPGEAPGQGPIDQENNIGLVASQAALNTVEGNRYALMNAEYEPFTVEGVGNIIEAIEPAQMTWVTLTTTTPTLRNKTFSTERGVALELAIQYDYSREGVSKLVSMLWQEETSGAAAITHIPADPPPPAEYDPGDWYDYTPPTESNFGDGFGRLHVAVNATLGTTDGFSATAPSYDDDSPGGGPTALYDFRLDPFDQAQGYLATDDGLYKATTLDGSPSWSQVLSPADILSETGFTYQGIGHVATTIHQQDYVGMFYAASSTRVYYSFSEDGGSTWTTALVSSDFSSVSHLAGTVADREGGNNSLVYATANTLTARQLFKSTDKGASWSVAGAMAASSGATTSIGVHVPYKDNASGDTAYVMQSSGAWKTTNGGSSFTALPAATHAKNGIGTFTQDKSKVYHWRSDDTFYISTDGGSTWTQKSASGISGTVRAAGGFPDNASLFYALTTSGIFVSTDGGASWTDKTGDWAYGFTITQYAGGTIVPDWTAT